jgi:hypothetical protein
LAQAQLNQYAFNVAMLGQAYSQIPPYLLGYNPYTYVGVSYGSPYGYSPYGLGTATPSTNPYGSGYGIQGPYGGGYSTPYSTDPTYGYLRGTADVISATGNYYATMQRARLSNEEAKRSQIDTRRKLLDEARDERMQQPTAENQRQQDLEAAYQRARRDPPATEIWSGRSLNDLLRNLVNLQKKGIKGPNIPVDEEVLKHVNLKVAGGNGNVGLLKGNGSLDWPLPLLDGKFAEGRQRLAEQLAHSIEQVRLGNRVEASRLNDMKAAVGRLSGALDQGATDLTPTKYIEAKRYLNQLGDALKALEDRKVADLVHRTWVVKTKNITDLVQYLGDNGLEIAPAVGSGDEAAYRALHAAMVAFDNGIAAVAKAPAPEK